MTKRQINCPKCQSTHTNFSPETAWERWCVDCDAVWDIRTPEEIEADNR